MSTNEVKPFHFRQCTEMSSSLEGGKEAENDCGNG